MKTPLYQEHQAPGKPETDYHAGLWFERFFNRYEDNWEVIKENPKLNKKDGKGDWIKTVIGGQGDSEKLASFRNRQQSLVTALKGQSQRYTTDWNFVSGMGNPHPVENGFSWHPTLAVPYLAGSAVKGLVKAWVEMNDELSSKEEKEARLKSWFGTADKTEVAEQAGDFIFFDAIPDKQPTLVCDIMTPHMGKWYENENKNGSTDSDAVPADWHEPTPIPFLSVKKARFIFSIVPRVESKINQLEDVFEALENALQWLGAGAKTAAGYGYMSSDKDAFIKDRKEWELQEAEKMEKNAKEQKEKNELAEQIKDCSPFAKKYFNEANEEKWAEKKERIWQQGTLDSWVERLEQEETKEERVVEHLADLLEHYFPSLLVEPEKVKGKKKKPVFSEKQKTLAYRIIALQKK
jgi:CRISPR-associated protein Cmr6